MFKCIYQEQKFIFVSLESNKEDKKFIFKSLGSIDNKAKYKGLKLKTKEVVWVKLARSRSQARVSVRHVRSSIKANDRGERRSRWLRLRRRPEIIIKI